MEVFFATEKYYDENKEVFDMKEDVLKMSWKLNI